MPRCCRLRSFALPTCRVDNMPPEPAASTACPSVAANSNSNGQAVQQQQAAMSPLAQVLQPRLPKALAADQQVKDVLLVLKLLEAINRWETEPRKFKFALLVHCAGMPMPAWCHLL